MNWIRTLWQQGSPPLQWSIVVVAALAACLTDLRRRRIPNLLTLPLLAVGLAYAGLTAGWAGLADAAAGAVIVAWPCLVLFFRAGGGAGDAKMLAATGAWLGVLNGLAQLTAVMLAGAVIGTVIAWRAGQLRGIFERTKQTTLNIVLVGQSEQSGSQEKPNKLTMPYGTAIAAGSVLAAGGVLIWRSWFPG